MSAAATNFAIAFLGAILIGLKLIDAGLGAAAPVLGCWAFLALRGWVRRLFPEGQA